MCNQACNPAPQEATMVAVPSGLGACRFGSPSTVATSSLGGCALPTPDGLTGGKGCPGGGRCRGGCQDSGDGCGNCGGNCGGPGVGVLSGINRGLKIARQVAALIAVKTAKRRALGIIDALNDFGSASTGAKLPVEGGEEIGPNVGRLQESGAYCYTFAANDEHPWNMFNFAEVCGKQAYVDQVPDEDGELADVYPAHCVAGTWGASYIPGVRVDLINEAFPKGTKRTKDSYSACGNANLIPRLQELGITDIDLCGLVFRICVGKSAIDLANAGFHVRVVVDATRDLDIPKFAPVIAEMKRLGIEIVTVDEVTDED